MNPGMMGNIARTARLMLERVQGYPPVAQHLVLLVSGDLFRCM